MIRFIAPVLALGAAALLFQSAGAAETAVRAPAPVLREAARGPSEVAVLAGGCFWGVEAVFEHVKGVRNVTSGFAGGSRGTATYDTVSSGRTPHAEAVRIEFDPRVVNYADLLRIHFSVVHDPTSLNAQGPDHGPQYRGAIFPQSPGQAKVAAAYLRQLGAAHIFARPIVTRIERGGFFPAEAYHQDFMRRNPNHPYIVANDRPKLQALRSLYPGVWRA